MNHGNSRRRGLRPVAGETSRRNQGLNRRNPQGRRALNSRRQTTATHHVGGTGQEETPNYDPQRVRVFSDEVGVPEEKHEDDLERSIPQEDARIRGRVQVLRVESDEPTQSEVISRLRRIQEDLSDLETVPPRVALQLALQYASLSARLLALLGRGARPEQAARRSWADAVRGQEPPQAAPSLSQALLEVFAESRRSGSSSDAPLSDAVLTLIYQIRRD
eukprot:scaffold1954_cov268-Pinguiococcus_pyrenoidosus.AAC.46